MRAAASMVAGVLMLLLVSCDTRPIATELRDTDEVVMCMGQYSKVFHHKESCDGLGNCKGGIEQTTAARARNSGRRACKICYE